MGDSTGWCIRLAYAGLLVVRPKVGAWSLAAGNGGPGDDDGESNEELEVVLASLEPLDGISAPPTELAAGDVLAAIDLETRKFYAVRLVGPPR